MLANLRLGEAHKVLPFTVTRAQRAIGVALAYDPPSRLAEGLSVRCATVRAGSDMVGLDAGELAGVLRIEVPLADVLDMDAFDVLVDFTNPAAYDWMKDIIKENLVKEGRAGGWMHDFGEYLPFDAVLYDGSDPMEYHNQYP